MTSNSKTLFYAVSGPFTCDVKHATIEQNLLMTRSTQHRKKTAK